jgi:hypothetical protein
MAFPINPSVDDTFEQNGVTYVWDGVAWGKQTMLLGSSTVGYDNSSSGLVADTLQGAVDEVSLDLDTMVKANLVSSGVINKQDDSLVFSTAVGNEYKLQDNSMFVNFDGKVVELPSGIEIDMTDNMPEVTVQDQATNGLVVQSSVNAGDYVVVDKEELVDNGDFELGDNGDWTKYGTSTISSGVYTSQPDLSGVTYQNINVIDGVKYIILFTFSNFTGSPNARALIRKSDNTVIGDQVTTTYNSAYSGSIIFTSDYTGQVRIQIEQNSNYGNFSANNISVQLVSDVYRAKEDIPSLTSLTDSRFEDRTQYGITNKILATRRNDGTIKTEVCFVDTPIEHCKNAHIVMTDNGYIKLSNGLYSKDGDVVTPLGTWTVSNSGSFHEVYNYFGIYADVNDDIGVISPLLNSTADCFNPSNVGTAIGHPQGIDKSKYVTADQWIDLRIEANAISEQDELNRVGTKAKSGQLDGIGGVVATVVVSYSPLISVYSGTSDSYINFSIYDNTARYFSDDVYIKGDSGKEYKITKIVNHTGDNVDRWYVSGIIDIAWDFTIGNHYSITKTLPHPSSGTALRTDIIGDPANYPQEWKDRLASGLPLIGINPLLVGQDGEDYVNQTGIVNDLCIASNKMITQPTALRYYDTGSGLAWSTTGGARIGTINNTMGDINYDRVPYLVSYTAKIPTTQVTDPKAVKLVGNYVTATNSHSVYKGNQLVPTGKVNVGNGANGLESRLLENNESINYDYDVYAKDTVSIVTGDRILNNVDGRVLVRNSGSFSGTWSSLYTTAVLIATEYIWSVMPTPTHNTISLDNSNSSAVKFIETIAEDDDGMAHYQVFAQEMVTNNGAYDGDDGEFTQLTNGTKDDDNDNVVKTIVASTPLNKYIGA